MTDVLATVRLAGAAQGFNWLPVFVADEQGIFARHGLRIEYLRMGSVDKATAAVREGEADVALTPPEGAIQNAVEGGGLRLIAANSVRLPMSLVATPKIAEIAQLRGARIGTSSLTEGTAIYTRWMLERDGLEYPRDYEFVLAGVHTARWDALRSGEIDCAPQPAPWSFLAEREGFHLIGEVNDVIPEIIFAAAVAESGWLDRNAAAAGALVAALAEAHAFVNDPRNDGVSVPIYQRITTPDEPELAERGFRYTRDMGMWPRGARIPRAAFEASLDAMVASGLLSKAAREPADRVLETRFGNNTDGGR
ncbi:ABC transporter substrate-binding protein [Agromyces sp. Soil535]|uniref:ABC transporter substrate-binding protein n=1 Tax=Agromyces sp. Soil535 TaxID=1736390 RepID=UPI0006FE3AF8|nr:ABC transporter substrate-binding protein [Agromyces sp. Soil535]KRE22288.1 ABC transporter substrate-binding protein [Agromyces sp. Soil535]